MLSSRKNGIVVPLVISGRAGAGVLLVGNPEESLSWSVSVWISI